MIYLDNCATTPVDPAVFKRMEPYFCSDFGNAASRWHHLGQKAADAVELARTQIATSFSCKPRDVIWTSGATEANNLALKGALQSIRTEAAHVVSQQTEHPAVLDPCESMKTQGVKVTLLPVDKNGTVSLEMLNDEVQKGVNLISVMWANNETGVIQPIEEIADICEKHGIIFHVDGAQGTGKLKIDLNCTPIDLLSISAHKLYGPKGAGALIFRRSDKLKRLTPQMDGGGHEGKMRSGTLNVPGIVGLGAACELCLTNISSERERLARMRNAFEKELTARIDDCIVNGTRAIRLPNVSNISFCGIDAESLLIALNGIAASTGSACSSDSLEPSHVLRAMGLSNEQMRGSVRFSFGRFNADSDYKVAADMITMAVKSLRQLQVTDQDWEHRLE